VSGRVEGKVAFITGAARGQGRGHAIRLAEEGADIIAVDLCGQVDSVPYPMATPDDLADTVKQVEALDRRIIATQADVRDHNALKAALDDGVAQLGRLDIVAANAGISSVGRAHELPEQTWQDMIDISLTGVWHACKAAIPHLIAGNRGGSIIITSSAAGAHGYGEHRPLRLGQARSGRLDARTDPGVGSALDTRQFAAPTTVNTDMIRNDPTYRLFRTDLQNPTVDDATDAFLSLNALPVRWVEPVDISNALLFLASDEARYITGVTLPIDAGCLVK
jgi:(+)-trans-carveol dehydrogenase